MAPLSSPEFKALPSGERATTIGADGNLWAIVAKPGHETALSRTLPTTGATNSYPIPASPGEALSISSGTDGHIWLVAATEARARASIKLVRVTPPDARPQVIPIPGRLQQTFTLTAAPAGAIWITAGQPGTYEGDYIARVQSNGAFKKFKLPGPAGSCQSPLGITSGSDGSLIFHAEAKNAMCRRSGPSYFARMSVGGHVTRLPTVGSPLYGVFRLSNQLAGQSTQLVAGFTSTRISGEPRVFSVAAA